MSAIGRTVPWHSLPVEEIFHRLATSSLGLSADEAARRLSAAGLNILPERKLKSPARIFLRQFTNFFVLILLFAAGLAFSVSFFPGKAAAG